MIRNLMENKQRLYVLTLCSGLAIVLWGILLYKAGIFYNGISVSQGHALCSSVGPLIALGGEKAVSTCSSINTAWHLLGAALLVSIIAFGFFVTLMLIKRNDDKKASKE